MKTLKIVIVTALCLLAGTIARAIPSYPGVLTMTQPDGTTLSYHIVGDEHYHGFVTTDGYLIKPDNAGGMRYIESIMQDGNTVMGMIAHNTETRPATEKAWLQMKGMTDFNTIYQEALRRKSPVKQLPGPSFPTTGNLKGIVLLVEFADNAMQEGHDSKLFHSVMNDENYTLNGATGSTRDYFVAQSMGKFTSDFDVFGPIKLKKSMMHYGQNDRFGNDSNPGQMVKEACEYASEQLGVDFSKYDYNNDNVVDFVYIIYAGYAESYGASSNTIWPHASNLTSLGIDCNVNGKQVQRYACSSELKYVSGTQLEGIGTFCHEFGHVLGLPDMYNTYNQQRVQLGAWDIMDTGSYNNESHTPPAYSAFERYSLGWMELTEIDTPADSMTLAELTENNVAYRISTADENEFFTLENRQQRGWDAYQPGRGLMIIHIAYESSAWDGNFVNAGNIQRYDLVEADGTQGTEQETDLYPTATNNLFTDYSVPNSLAWNGTPTDKGVTNIRDNNGVISFRFMKDRLHRPVAEEATNITAESFIAQWQPVDGAESYRLNVSEILPDSINPIITEEEFSLMTEGNYPKADINDIGEELDSYLSQPGWYGSKIYQAGGYMLVGYYGQSGSLRSPLFDLSGNNRECTVAFHVASYPGKTVSYTVSMIDIDTNTTVEEYNLKANKTETEVILRFHQGTRRTRLSIDTNKERIYFNNLRILKGSVADDAVWTVGPKEWKIDNIPDTSYKVDGLTSNRTYLYNVQALSAEEQRSSLPSNNISVTTQVSTGIEHMENDADSPVIATTYYDITGCKVTQPRNGMYIRRDTHENGMIRISKIFIP